MSLYFGASAGDSATKSSPVGLTALATFTILMWIRPTSLITNRVMWRAGGATAGNIQFRLSDASGNMQISQGGVVASSYITNDASIVSGAWNYAAATGEIGVGYKMYRGSFTAIAAERTYGTTTAGTGPPNETGATTATIGNHNTALNVDFPGDIGPVQVYNRVLSLGEIKSLQFDLAQRMLSGCTGRWRLGDNGVAVQPDYSGNGNAMTVTGATKSNNAPLRAQTRRIVRVARAAGGAPPSTVPGPLLQLLYT